MREKSGFSILELVVALCIFVTLIAIGVPNFRIYLPKYRLKSAARDLYSNMQLARMAAVKSGGTCTLTYDSGQNNYTITGAVTKTVNLDDYGSGVSFQAPPTFTSVASTTFNSRGLCAEGYAYLSNANNSAYYRVGTLITGIVRLQRWAGGTSWQ